MNILELAAGLVRGPRQRDYGEPAETGAAIGRMWGAILSAHFRRPIRDIPAPVVWMMLICVKQIRHAHRYKRDNTIDIAGYADCADRAQYGGAAEGGTGA